MHCSLLHNGCATMDLLEHKAGVRVLLLSYFSFVVMLMESSIFLFYIGSG